MKLTTAIGTTLAIAVLLTSAGQALAQKKNTESLTASQILNKIMSETEETPLCIYPPGYIDWLSFQGDSFHFASSMEIMEEGSGPMQMSLAAGDRANMVRIQAGTFVMGSTNGLQSTEAAEVPLTTVVFSTDFYMGKYEVTQAEYEEIMGTNPSLFSGNPDYPVEQVYWADATNYCHLLTVRERQAGNITTNQVYRLPTEAEWEYACRAGTNTEFHYGTGLYSGMANFDGRIEYETGVGDINNPSGIYLGTTTNVGSYTSNSWGLYDMHGNVHEWCLNRLYFLPGGSVVDPPFEEGEHPAIRGGSWGHSAWGCRSARRTSEFENQTNPRAGFRVVMAEVVPGWRLAIEEQPAQPTYTSCIVKEPGKDNLIVVTHGRIPAFHDPIVSTAWVDSMSNSIAQYLTANGLTNWQVVGYKWIDKADVSPLTVLENALQTGNKLGECLTNQGWSHIHLISHSAGAGVIQAALEQVKNGMPDCTVHCTFLDPFVGILFGGRNRYGNVADWSDQYFSHDIETSYGLFSFTEGSLFRAYNVDVTQLNKVEKSRQFISTPTGVIEPCRQTIHSHDWSIDFYSNTVNGNVLPEYEGFGFPLSMEGGNWEFALSQYPTGNIPSRVLGIPDQQCYSLASLQLGAEIRANMLEWATIKSASGIVEKYINGVKEIPQSPVWLATIISVTNPVNFVSLDAEFIGTNEPEGLLSVYWDTNIIGLVDEKAVPSGMQHYSFSFPNAISNSTHIFGLRLDNFTTTLSSVVVTNIILGLVGVSEPFKLSVTTTTFNNLPVFELSGQAGFNYPIQASTDLIDWTDIAVLINTNGTVRFFDEEATNYSHRFYRAVIPY